MSHFTIATLAKGAAAAALACCVVLPGHAQTRLAAEKLDAEKFEKKLQDTRDTIKKDITTTNPTGAAHTNQTVIDICKKNPALPQCKL
jgi:L-ascorbate metabolism protein UlaG (beta-lactamase superfamily)